MALDLRTLARNFGSHQALAQSQSTIIGSSLKDSIAAKAKASAPSSRSLLTLAAYGCMDRRLDKELGDARSSALPVEKAVNSAEGLQFLPRL